MNAQEIRYGGTLTIGIVDEISITNPFLVNLIVEFDLMRMIYDPLTRLGPGGEVYPMLAASWEMSPDGKVLTLKIVQNATWHDGTPLTGEDVVFYI